MTETICKKKICVTTNFDPTAFSKALLTRFLKTGFKTNERRMISAK